MGFVFVSSVVSILTLSAVILSWSEIGLERQTKKETAARRTFKKELLKERERLDRNMAALDKLLKENSIDDQTHERYKKILQMSYEQKRQQSRTKFRFAKKLISAK